LHDDAIAHDDDLIGQGQGVLLVVRYQQGCGPGRTEDFPELFAELDA